MRKWIKVSEKLPENASDVTLMSVEYHVVNGYYWNHWGKDAEACWYISCGAHEGRADTDDITHWQPLPSPPED